MTDVGHKIRTAREAARWTQSRLAEQIDTTQTRISLWESGRAMPSLTNIIAVAVALRCALTFTVDGATITITIAPPHR